MNNNSIIKIGNYFEIGNNKPFFLIAGPCQAESLDHSLFMAESIKKICDKLSINYVFKSSFDKANRTSVDSKRGLGLEEGMRVFEQVKKQIGVPVITDVHLPAQAGVVAETCDVLQIPAFLCRQSDLLEAIAKTKKPIHVKKINSFGNHDVILSDRGTAFGYGTLVMDMRAFPIMSQWAPVTVDCTHACQLPGGRVTGGNRDMALVLASAAISVGVSGVFAEVHDNPPCAPSDSANMIYLNKLEKFLARLKLLDEIAKENPIEIENYNILA